MVIYHKSVRFSLTVKVLPLSGLLSTDITPSFRSTTLFIIERPRPEPEMFFVLSVLILENSLKIRDCYSSDITIQANNISGMISKNYIQY